MLNLSLYIILIPADASSGIMPFLFDFSVPPILSYVHYVYFVLNLVKNRFITFYYLLPLSTDPKEACKAAYS